MKKSLKNIFAFCLSIIMLATMTVPVFAAETYTEDSLSPIAISKTARVLEGNDAISALRQRSGLSYYQAVQEYNELVARFERLEERYITYDVGMGFIVEVGCLVKVACGGGHCNFAEIIKTWSEASGTGVYTWNGFYANATIEGILMDSIRFQSRGTLEVAVDVSLSGGYEAAGFSISATVGTTVYLRKTVSIDKVWSRGS